MENKHVGLSEVQESKYTTNVEGKLVNRKTGEAIPDNEPVFVFRAKDSLALKMLTTYRHTLSKGDHRDAVDKRIRQFEEYMAQHPEKVRFPN